VGYKRYLDLIEDLTSGKQLVSSGMTKETERCRAAVDLASKGEIVSLVSSGDPGVYGMAGLALEMAQQSDSTLPIEIVPGVSAAGAAAAAFGAPLMLDYACVSLSDLLVPWSQIKRRLEAVAEVDLVVALYNPRSRKRVSQLEEAAEIFRKFRAGTTPVGIGTGVGTDEQHLSLTDLDHFLDFEINMRSVVIIGNTTSKVCGNWFITPRGYKL
jgi:precorrin-3B C17-methyltransferase